MSRIRSIQVVLPISLFFLQAYKASDAIRHHASSQEHNANATFEPHPKLSTSVDDVTIYGSHEEGEPFSSTFFEPQDCHLSEEPSTLLAPYQYYSHIPDPDQAENNVVVNESLSSSTSLEERSDDSWKTAGVRNYFRHMALIHGCRLSKSALMRRFDLYLTPDLWTEIISQDEVRVRKALHQVLIFHVYERKRPLQGQDAALAEEDDNLIANASFADRGIFLETNTAHKSARTKTSKYGGRPIKSFTDQRKLSDWALQANEETIEGIVDRLCFLAGQQSPDSHLRNWWKRRITWYGNEESVQDVYSEDPENQKRGLAWFSKLKHI